MRREPHTVRRRGVGHWACRALLCAKGRNFSGRRPISHDLHLSKQQMGLIFGAFGLVLCACSKFPWGCLAIDWA